MQSLRELYKAGMGPSSSHTMGPRKAAEIFNKQNPAAQSFRVYLYGSLALTGKGHLTDLAVITGLEPKPVQIVWEDKIALPRHPNALKFEALDEKENILEEPAGNGKTSYMGKDEMAKALAFTALDEKHVNKSYTLTSNKLLNYYEIADILSNIRSGQISF